MDTFIGNISIVSWVWFSYLYIYIYFLLGKFKKTFQKFEIVQTRVSWSKKIRADAKTFSGFQKWNHNNATSSS